MTIDEQSVNAMMPKRTFGDSGESSAYAGPAQPLGTPASSPAAREPAVVVKNLRRVNFIDVPPPLELVRNHCVRKVVCLSGRRVLQECAREQVCVSPADLNEVV